MAEPATIRVPRESINDDTVTLVRWHAAPGERVRAGAPLFEIETSKAVILVESDAEGYLEILCREGEEIAVGEPAARLHDRALAPAADGGHARPAPAAASAEAASAEGPVLTRKARERIEASGLDPALFRHLAIVREADVLRALEERAAAAPAAANATSAAGASPAAAPAAAASAPPETAAGAARARGFLRDAQVASETRGHGVLWVGINYLFRNYLLGLLARVAPRGLLLPIHRLRGVRIGRDCFIDPTAIVETAYPENVRIGNDVRVAAGAVIMTHLKAPHLLRESGLVPMILKEVVLEDHCFVGINAVIMPGVRVGEASVVASGAVVFGDVPPYTTVAGNPAKVVKRFPRAGTRA